MNADVQKIGYVFVACLCYMIFHTKSLFLSVVSLTNVIMSVPISLYVYSELLGIDYFSSMHLSVIIIIVGIGSDDIFVFHDNWQNSLCIGALRDKPILRLSFVWRNAAVQMLVTSITSSVAFLSCARSQIMPIRSFGIFSFVIVIVCYLITILVQPMNYYIYEKYIKNIGCKDDRLNKIPQENYEFGLRTSSTSRNIDEDGFELKDKSDRSIEFSEYF